MKTTRTIKSIKLTINDLAFDQFDRLLAIFEKLGEFVMKFELVESSMSIRNLIQILQTLPNLEFLSLKYLELVEDKNNSVSIVELNLNRLTEIISWTCCVTTMNMFNKLPQDILNDFTVLGPSLDQFNMNEFFQRQSKIKNLYIHSTSTMSLLLPLDNLKLKKLELWISSGNENNIENALRNQKLLTHLDLTDNYINNAIFKEISDMCHLETLNVCVDWITNDHLKDISKLKKITELSIISNENKDKKHLEAISTIQNPLLKKFKFELNHVLFEECYISRIASNFPNLQFLTIEGIISIESTYFLLKNFNKLEVLDIFSNDYIHTLDMSKLYEEGLANYNLKVLTINVRIHLNSKLIRKFSNNFTNLEIFTLFSLDNITTNVIRKLLKRFKKLTHLEISSGCRTVSKNVLTFVKKYGTNLVHIELNGMRIKKTYVIQQLSDTYKGKLIFETGNFNVRV